MLLRLRLNLEAQALETELEFKSIVRAPVSLFVLFISCFSAVSQIVRRKLSQRRTLQQYVMFFIFSSSNRLSRCLVFSGTEATTLNK